MSSEPMREDERTQSGASERILVTEDERAQREALTAYLRRQGYEVDAVGSAEEALELLRSKAYAVLITDLRLPGMDGLQLLRRAHEIDEGLCALLTTAYASVESAVEALRRSAQDYLLKPLILEEVGRKIRDLLERQALLKENAVLRRALEASPSSKDIVADSSGMQEVQSWILRAGQSGANVLISGETGTGKELVARAIHAQGANADQPFLVINLAALPESLAESELFGHERGAFTGAEERRDGILRAAGRGTVLLDEVAELELQVQAKLLRALEAREVKPLGSDVPVPFQARILAATHRDIEQMVESGKFREDLYYRLNVIRLRVPPLRERREDIPSLARSILHQGREHRRSAPFAIDQEAMRALCSHSWRGNVRELRNVLERASILAEEGEIVSEHLPPDIQQSAMSGLELQTAMDAFERNHIATVLRLCGGNKEAAAKELGISPATLYRRLEKHALRD